MAVDVEKARGWILATFPAAREGFPFGPETRVFKNAKGKMFALMTDEEPGRFRVSLKLTEAEADEARVLPFVHRAPYLGRYHWVAVHIEQDAEWDITQDWISRSWELIAGGAKKKRG